MEYLLSFLEGIVTFISPCLLPMLPVYIGYFAGGKSDEKNRAVVNSLGFVAGFTLLFVLLGAFAGSLGALLSGHQRTVNVIMGIIMILFGLNFMEVIRIPFINNVGGTRASISMNGFLSAMLFGIVFSISWTPCVGTFLGSALMLAANSGETTKGILMLLSFSMGLGIPFIISAVLIDSLKNTFNFIKRHYRVVNIISGGLLIVLGIAVATGLINYVYALI